MPLRGADALRGHSSGAGAAPAQQPGGGPTQFADSSTLPAANPVVMAPRAVKAAASPEAAVLVSRVGAGGAASGDDREEDERGGDQTFLTTAQEIAP